MAIKPHCWQRKAQAHGWHQAWYPARRGITHGIGSQMTCRTAERPHLPFRPGAPVARSDRRRGRHAAVHDGLRRGAWDAACCTLRIARNVAVRRVSVCAIQCARTVDRMRLYPHACAEGGGGGGGGVCAHAGDLGDRMCVRACARARCVCVWMVWAEVRRGVRGERSVPMTRECLAAPRSPEPNCVGTGRLPIVA